MMNRDALRETLTGMGVVLSLIFVALEIRANTEAVRGTTIQGIAENRFRQVELSIIDFEVISGGAPEFRSPFFRTYWEARRKLYSPDFAAHVDRDLLPLSGESPDSFVPDAALPDTDAR
jgi:hypothetical protein